MRLYGHPLRAFELHEATAHAHGEREVRDLGDAILLTDPLEADPFLNRLSGLRLPSDAAACDARLAELYALFAGLGRRPHVWTWSGVSTPADLERRLIGDGFIELGGAFLMALDGQPAPAPLPPGVRLERASTAGERARDVLDGAARVMVEAFGVVAGSAEHIAADLSRASGPARDVCVAWVGDEPVAAGRRYTGRGMTHLSSIATRPAWWGRGLGAAVTAALTADGQRAGGTLVHLGVEAQNARARRLYERLGFVAIGERIADLLL